LNPKIALTINIVKYCWLFEGVPSSREKAIGRDQRAADRNSARLRKQEAHIEVPAINPRSPTIFRAFGLLIQ